MHLLQPIKEKFVNPKHQAAFLKKMLTTLLNNFIFDKILNATYPLLLNYELPFSNYSADSIFLFCF